MVLKYSLRQLLKSRRFIRRFSTESVKEPPVNNERKDIIQAWQIHSFGKVNNLKLSEVQIPVIRKHSEVLVQIKYASINPIDVAMLGGYGNVVLDVLRKTDPNCRKDVCLPLTLGRDFSGEVIAKGANVRPDIMVGDTVYGVIPPHFQGCHAQIAVADESLICRKPDFLSNSEAGCILYAGLTAWSCLKLTGDMLLVSPKGKKTLIIGACGGVGHFALQLLKAWGASVVTTCRTDGIKMMEELDADVIIDYTDPAYMENLKKMGKFDVILDASGCVEPADYVPLLKDWANSKFIALRSPFLKNTDSYGLFGGMVRNAADFIKTNITSGAPSKGSTVRWGFFMPIATGVREICNLVSEKKIKPVIEKEFSFEEVPKAYERMNEGHLRGKIVVSVNK